MLTFESEFSNSLKRNNDVFPILSIAGSSTIYLSTRDVTVDSQAYDGRLLDAPGITSSINLRNHTSRTNNITLRIANNGYATTFGQRTNKVVTIYFATNGTLDDLDNCLKVFTGRVVSISKLTDKEIAVNCEDYAAWRYHKILNEQIERETGYNLPVQGKFKPISYGDYTTDANSSTVASPALCTSKTVRPAHLITHDSDFIYYDEGLNNSGGRGEIYIPSIDRFIPIENATTATSAKFNTNVIRINNVSDTNNQNSFFQNTVRLSPVTHIANSAVSNLGLDVNVNAANAINDDDDDFITFATTGSASGSPAGTAAAMSGQLNGKIAKVVAVVIAAGSGFPEGVVSFSASHIYDNGGTDTLSNIVSSTMTTGNGWSGTNVWSTFVNDAKYVVTKDITSDWNTGSGQGYEPGVKLNDIVVSVRITDQANARSLKLYSVYLDITTFVDVEKSTTTYSEKSMGEQIPETIYVGADGTLLEGSYTELSDHGPTEVHENILTNFGPGASFIDTSTQDTVEGNYNAAGLVRCTIDNPDMTVQDALNKLQKEAGFISYVRPSDGKVAYLIEDGSSKSVNAILTTAMYRNPVFGTIPLSQMIWKVNYNYNKHPATNTYLLSSYVEDTTTKSTYAFGDNDGVITLQQDWVNESEAAINLLKLFKYQRITAQCEILDPTKWALEIGDIITFSDPPADFRLRDATASYTDYQFRITETTRTVNSLKIKAMEVYKS